MGVQFSKMIAFPFFMGNQIYNRISLDRFVYF